MRRHALLCLWLSAFVCVAAGRSALAADSYNRDFLNPLAAILKTRDWILIGGGSRLLTPFGRDARQGFEAILSYSARGIETRVFIWQTIEEAPVTVPERHGDLPPAVSEILGKGRGGYVYIHAPPEALKIWPGVKSEIARALGAN